MSLNLFINLALAVVIVGGFVFAIGQCGIGIVSDIAVAVATILVFVLVFRTAAVLP